MLEKVYFGNTVEAYIVALGAFILLWLVLRFVQFVILKKLAKLSQKTETDIDDTFIKIFKSIKPGFYNYLAFYLALFFLEIHPTLNKWLWVILLIWIVYQIIESIHVLIDYIIQKKAEADDPSAVSAFRFLGNLVKWALWIVGLILVLSNLGINVNSLIAGLGIGGIAIAMAVQGILEDLFSAFSIHFDKPFKVGDAIKVGSDVGIVERIGIKSTRLRSLSSFEELVISNKELTSARIYNYRNLKERRVTLTFGLLYETPNEKLEKVPGIVKSVIESASKCRFDRAHFTKFNDSSLDFEVVYFVESSDYMEYMDAQQKINLNLKAELEKLGVSMAYPTRTIYMQK